MALSQVACLVPLNDDLKENNSAPRIVLSEGPNTIGRDNFSVADKRLSRKHLIVTASAQGDSAVLHVEGTNPVVVKSGAGRQKICRGEELMIDDGDVIEFIPGHYFFKFVAFPCDNNSKNECKNNGSNERAPKKARLGGVQDHSKDGIRDFHLPEEEVPRTFRLLRVQGLPSWANTSSVSIEDIIQGDMVVAILCNYMVDVDWLISACPKLGKIPQVLVIHGEGDGRQEYMQRRKPANWILHKPRLPISFGTHHSKAIILIYPRGVRIVVHTANLIYVDWNNKTQGLWMQDFPWKNGESPSKITGFEVDLIDYLGVLKWPEFSASIPGRGNLKIDASFFKMFDYADATVRLVASVPGYHTGTSMRKWGHMKFRTILDSCNFADEFKKSPLIYQFSSLGSLDEKWLSEFTSSMSAGLSVDKTPLGYGDPQIIWPTVEDVRCSLEGYAAGNAFPSPLKNVEKGFLKKYWFKWKADHSGRGRAMPHIKTFTRYNGQNLAWFLLTSSNLSKAAWGALQKNNSQLMIRSYELGVLFIPSLIKRRARFSCTRNMYPVQDKSEPADNTTNRRTKFVTLAWQGDHDTASAADVIRMPVPYELPPQRYSSEDVPWSWDRIYSKKDVYGQVWPRQVQLYATDHD